MIYDIHNIKEVEEALRTDNYPFTIYTGRTRINVIRLYYYEEYYFHDLKPVSNWTVDTDKGEGVISLIERTINIEEK